MTALRQLLLIPYAFLVYKHNILDNVPKREYELHRYR